MNTLNFMKEATVEQEAFQEHPALGLCQEERLLYLKGIVLITTSHENVELNPYIQLLIQSLECDAFDSLVQFRKQPEKETFLLLLKTFRGQNIAWTFLLDALIALAAEKNDLEDRSEMIDFLARKLEIEDQQIALIKEFYYRITEKQWNSTKAFFFNEELNQKFFKHIILYYNIDIDELSYHTKENLSSCYFMEGLVLNHHFVGFLQNLHDEKEIFMAKDKVFHKNGDLYFDLKNSKISYDLIEARFRCRYEYSILPVTHYTIKAVEHFERENNGNLIVLKQNGGSKPIPYKFCQEFPQNMTRILTTQTYKSHCLYFSSPLLNSTVNPWYVSPLSAAKKTAPLKLLQPIRDNDIIINTLLTVLK